MNDSSLTKIIKKVMPSVVSIVVARTLKAVEKEIPPEMLPFLPYEKSKLKIPDEMFDAHGLVKVGGGSGFVVDGSGIILTNKHVLSGDDSEYTVITDDDRHFAAKILACDPVDDVAILKIEARDLPALPFGDSSRVDLGQAVLAFGNALGLFKNTVSAGIISGLSRSIQASPEPEKPIQELRGLIQTDAAINPGNSGGPLVDMRGKVIGINTAIVAGAQNLGFTIPINAAKRDLADLKKHGRIIRPLLGLRYLTIGPELQAKMKLPTDYGALIVGKLPHFPAIVPGSPAQKAGFNEKDIVLECDGVKITQAKTIQDILEEKEVGDVLQLKTLRGSDTLNINITLAERKQIS